MKVNQDYSVNMKPIPQETKVARHGVGEFKTLVETEHRKIQSKELQQLLQDIEKAGERLARSRNFRDLTKYKSLIKNFLKEAVDLGLAMENSSTWDGFGQSRVLKIVKEIDEKLIQLTDELLEKEKENIHILGLLGEIKGLLINLYT